MKNIFKLKKFKKAIIGISAISFGLSVGLATGLISDQSRHAESKQNNIINQELLGEDTKQSFEEIKTTISEDQNLKNDFKSQLSFYQSTPIEFSLNFNENQLQNHAAIKSLNSNSENIKNNKLISSEKVNQYVFEKIAEYQQDYLNGDFTVDVVLENANKAGWSNEKIIDTINSYQTLNSSDNVSEDLSNKNQTYGLALHSANYGGQTFGGAIDKIDELLRGMAITSAVGWVAAAGFWAAAWWFGISIPWAVAATSLAAGLTANTIAISLLKDKMKAPINKGYVNNWTSIATKDAFISTTNKSAFDNVYDFLSELEKIWNYISDFSTEIEVISTLISVTSFAVPSSFLVQKLAEIILKYIRGSILSSIIFFAIKGLIFIGKRFS